MLDVSYVKSLVTAVKRLSFLPRLWRGPAAMTDTELDEHLAQIGIERVFDALDRLTAPAAAI